MLHGVKHLVTAIPASPGSDPRAVSLPRVSFLTASRVGHATALLGAIELRAEGGPVPEWVRLLAPGANKARDGRAFTVADAGQVVRLSTEWKGGIDLLVDYEHQFDRAPANGQPAPAAGWIKELSATGPDGTPGIWVRIAWTDRARAAIEAGEYRYLSAAIAHDRNNVVQFVPRASLTNQPAVDTATALFSADRPPVEQSKESDVNLLQKMLAALGLAATTTEDQVVAHVGALATLAAALAKQMGVEVSVLSAMTAEQVTGALARPLADKIATLSAAAKVAADATPDAIVAGLRGLGVDPAAYVPMSVHQDVAQRLATLNAQLLEGQIAEAAKAGKLTPAMVPWARTLTADQLTAYLSTAAVIVAPGADPNPAQPTLATLSADDRAEAARHGVTEEAWLKARQDQAADDARLRTLVGR